MSTEPIIDRDTYRTIKKMSREKLNAFLLRYADGLTKNEHVIDLRELEAELKTVKGIVEKQLEEIMVIIEKLLGV